LPYHGNYGGKGESPKEEGRGNGSLEIYPAPGLKKRGLGDATQREGGILPGRKNRPSIFLGKRKKRGNLGSKRKNFANPKGKKRRGGGDLPWGRGKNVASYNQRKHSSLHLLGKKEKGGKPGEREGATSTKKFVKRDHQSHKIH